MATTPESGFTSSTKEEPYSVSILFGPSGARKSSTVFLSCPEPIRTLNFDGRDLPAMERALDTCSICRRMRDDHEDEDDDHKFRAIDIERSPLRSTDDFDKMDTEAARKAGGDILKLFWRDYDYALKICSPTGPKRRRGTVCIDTFGELKPVLCAAIIGTSEIPYKQLRAQGRLNQICRDIVARARLAKVNLVITARESEIYVNDKATGHYKPKVPPALLEAVDWAAFVNVKTEIKQRKAIITPQLTMTKCGGNDSELMATYTPSDWKGDGPWAWANYNQFTKSKISDWCYW